MCFYVASCVKHVLKEIYSFRHELKKTHIYIVFFSMNYSYFVLFIIAIVLAHPNSFSEKAKKSESK